MRHEDRENADRAKTLVREAYGQAWEEDRGDCYGEGAMSWLEVHPTPALDYLDRILNRMEERSFGDRPEPPEEAPWDVR